MAKKNIMHEMFGDINDDSAVKGELTIKQKCATDFKLFCEYYLADSFTSPWSENFHFWLINKLEDIIFKRANEETKTVVASPRGHAKSTLVTFAFCLWLICYNYKKFIVIVSATSDVAKQFLINIRAELDYNDKILEDFGSLKNKDIWNSSGILTSSKVYVTSKSAGTQLRGLNFNGTRPDMVIFDDLETTEQVLSVTQTTQLENWFNADALPMGSPTADYFYIGTVLSYESLLYHMLTKGEYSPWIRKRFQAVIKFSESPLWEEWEEIMVDLERGDKAYDDAKTFYEEHKEEMLAGTEVLWENQRPNMYRHLMERKVASEEGFASEYQNDPQTEKTRIFKTEWFENNYYEEPPKLREVVVSIDPAIKSKKTNDYSVVSVVGRAENGYFYVLEADAQHRTADKLLDDAKRLIAKYYAHRPKVVVETNQMQAFFSNTLQRDLINSGIYLEWIEVNHTSADNKARRIESLAPHIRQGHIKFKKDQKILINQLRNYPKDHDDAPDSLEMALHEMLKTQIARFSFGSVGKEITKTGNLSMDAIKRNFGI